MTTKHNHKKIILGFVGDIASGKGTVCKYLAEKYQVPSYKFSTMLRDILNRMYLDVSRENLQILSKILRENFGQDVMSQVIAQDVNNAEGAIIAVDGIRRPTDITYLKNLEGFHLVYITADPKIRWQRLVERAENEGDADKTFDAFLADEQAEADQLIKQLGREAEFVITNDGDFDTLYTQIEDILTQCRA